MNFTGWRTLAKLDCDRAINLPLSRLDHNKFIYFGDRYTHTYTTTSKFPPYGKTDVSRKSINADGVLTHHKIKRLLKRRTECVVGLLHEKIPAKFSKNKLTVGWIDVLFDGYEKFILCY